MTEERMRELLSRALDEDLSPREAAVLEASLEDRPELAGELEAMRRLRQDIRRAAAGMAPPADLDRLVAPLRQGVAPADSRSTRWWWLAAAACLVVGFTVAYRLGVIRGTSAVDFERFRRAASAPVPDRPEHYQLRALPTAAPDSPAAAGPSERLLARPDELPDPGTSGPLVVIGPLPWEEDDVVGLVIEHGSGVGVAKGPDIEVCRHDGLGLVVTVAAARVVAATGHGETAAACAAALVGWPLDGLADGRYAVRVVVGPDG